MTHCSDLSGELSRQEPPLIAIALEQSRCATSLLLEIDRLRVVSFTLKGAAFRCGRERERTVDLLSRPERNPQRLESTARQVKNSGSLQLNGWVFSLSRFVTTICHS